MIPDSSRKDPRNFSLVKRRCALQRILDILRIQRDQNKQFFINTLSKCKEINDNINLVNKLDDSIQIRLINHLAKETILKFDNEQFNRLFFNLIKNSLESIQEKAIKDNKIDKNIDIEIRQRRDYININIVDTGTGFKNKKTKDIIKSHFTTKEKGTGLGLSIVDKIISDHEGSIKFLNHNKGAKIQIIIPYKK